MEFEVVNGAPSREYDRKIILSFLASVDPSKLSSEVLDSFGWGDEGDPIATAVEILKVRAETW
jgi:hypothetical protein